MHDTLVDFHVGLGREPLVAVWAPEALLALVDGLDVLDQLGSETSMTIKTYVGEGGGQLASFKGASGFLMLAEVCS